MDEINKKTKNLKAITLKIYSEHRYLLIPSSQTKIKSKLFFDFENQVIKLNSKPPEKALSSQYYSFFLGVMEIQNESFLLLVEDVQEVGEIGKHKFYKVVNLRFISTTESVNQQSKKIMNFIIEHYKRNFYFSYTVNMIENSFFNKNEKDDKKFIANYNLIKFLLIKKTMTEWAIPIFQGFFQETKLIFDEEIILYTIITKNEQNGELIKVFSIFKIQNSSYFKIHYFDISLGHNKNFFQSIYEKIKNKERIFLINTYHFSKRPILKEIELTVRKLSSKFDTLKYLYFFLKYKELENSLDLDKNYGRINDVKNIYKYFGDSVFEDDFDFKKQQLGQFIILSETNFDRSGIFLILELLFEILKFNLDSFGVLNNSYSLNYKNFYRQTDFNFVKLGSELFDTLFDFSKTKFYDFFKAENYGIYNLPPDYINYRTFQNFISSSKFFLKDRINNQQKKTQTHKLNILILTYNISGLNPQLNTEDLQHIFEKIKQKNSDIVILGLQELMELKISYKNLKSMVKPDDLVQKWQFLFLEKLNQYTLFHKQNMLGLQTFILVKKNLKPTLKNFDQVKMGVMNLGTKGATFTVIEINNIFLEFFNIHLSAGYGEEARNNRKEDLNAILNFRKENLFLNNIDYSFIFGDTNFKVNASKSEVINAFRQKINCYRFFSDREEGNFYLDNYNFEYKETEVIYPPTYKYNHKKQTFHDSERTPSWTDRIFYNSDRNNKIDILEYDYIRIFISDHFPVYMVCDVYC